MQLARASALLFVCASSSCAASRAAPAASAPSAICTPAPTSSSAGATASAASFTRPIAIGPITFQASISPTAQLFYVVDQLSEWAPWCHPQYKRWPDARSLLGPGERAFLASHKALRDRIESDSPRLGRLFTDFAAFAGAYVTDVVPLFLIPATDGDSGGGGYNGGFMQVEAGRSAVPTLIHEAFHLVMVHRLKENADAAASCRDGLDTEGLNEGIAYAVSPGILHDGDAADDVLARPVANDRQRRAPASDGYVRDRRFGLMLRPILENALANKGTLDAFLPAACASWKALGKQAWP